MNRKGLKSQREVCQIPSKSMFFYWSNPVSYELCLTVSDSPIKGTESDVSGMISATSSMKTVSESKTVIPGKLKH